MNAKTVFKAGQDKSRLREKWIPFVRFEIPSDLKGDGYIRWLQNLFADFIRSLSDSKLNQNYADFCLAKVGDEGGVADIHIGKEYFDHCKLFVYDGNSSPFRFYIWKGIVMRNHSDQLWKVEPLYKLAEEFESFLRKKGVAYLRFGRLIGDKGESEQITE